MFADQILHIMPEAQKSFVVITRMNYVQFCAGVPIVSTSNVELIEEFILPYIYSY